MTVAITPTIASVAPMVPMIRRMSYLLGKRERCAVFVDGRRGVRLRRPPGAQVRVDSAVVSRALAVELGRKTVELALLPVWEHLFVAGL